MNGSTDMATMTLLVALSRLAEEKLTMVQLVTTAERVGHLARLLWGRRRLPADAPALSAAASELATAAKALVPGARCLHMATAAHVWLAGHGVPSRVVVGFRKRDGLEGHAWLEVLVDELQIALFREDDDGFREVWRQS